MIRLAIIKRYCKDRIKKIITKRYCIKPSQLFNRNRYYIIRRRAPWAGFYANYLYVAGHVVYALKKGYIPVVDMQNYPTLYNEDREFRGTKNAWEYYFEQPGGVDLTTAMNSGNYILSDYSTMRENIPYKDGPSYFFIDWNKSAPLEHVIAERLQPKQDIIETAVDFWNHNCIGKTVLGVHYRGTDKKVEVKNHFLSASLENYLHSVEKCISEYNPNIILLCTDDEEAIRTFNERYPDKVIFSNAFRVTEGETEGIHLMKGVNRKHHNYLLGKEVIVDVTLLSYCDFFVFSHSNVATAAMFINNQKYRKTYFVED